MATLKTLSPARHTGMVLALVGSLVGLAPTDVLASAKGADSKQEAAPSASKEEKAKEAFFKALDLVDQKKHKEALVAFERAQRLAPNFHILYNIGLIKLKLNDLEGAYAALSAYVKEGGNRIPSDQLSAVLNELEGIKPKLTWLTIEIDDARARATLDGKVIPPEKLSGVLYVKPGKRKVVVLFSNGRREERSFVGTAGKETLLKFQTPLLLKAEPSNQRSRQTSPLADAGVTEPQVPSFPWEPWAVTGVLGAGGAILGVLTLQERENEKLVHATPGVTQAELEGVRTNVSRLALATDITLGLAAASALVSIYWTMEWSEDKERAEIRASVDPSINGIRIGGTF